MATKILAWILPLIMAAGCVQPSPPDAPGPQDHAEAFLAPDAYGTIRVDVDYASEYVPSALALDGLRTTLEEVTGKRVVIETPETFQTDQREWTGGDMASVHARTFDHDPMHPYAAGDEALLHVVYFPGEWEGGNTNVAYYHRSLGYVGVMADLMDDVRPIVTQHPQRAPDLAGYTPKYERFVLVHELGHALGLVDCGAPVTHEGRAAGGCHSTSADSPMYDASSDFEGRVQNDVTGPLEPVWRFDEHDLDDIRAYQTIIAARRGG